MLSHRKMGKYIFLKCSHKNEVLFGYSLISGSVETENNGLAEFWNLRFTQLYRKNNVSILYKKRMHNQDLDA
jgi:hypothetical protein